jgi:crotonobetainyl-CoA:carnitine CoA-transferase CaiB-like acyl-CoA transferase
MSGPLTGTRILDLTHVLNGPFGTMLLAHMGAEVLKVEHGAGDHFRHSWMPDGVTRDGYEFIWVNSNKKSITLNLKHEQGKEIFRRLVAKCDVVVENFTVGVMDRLGLGYEALREINPRIIYACSRGYGESGPYANIRAYAGTIMAMSGWQDVAQTAAGHPGMKVVGIGDEAAGVSTALGVCAALYAREQTGRGQRIEISMQEAMMGFMISQFHTFFEGVKIGSAPKACADGYYAYRAPEAEASDRLWRQLLEAIGGPELAHDAAYATADLRRENYDSLEKIVSEWVRTHTRKEIWQVFGALGLATGPVLSLSDVLDDPHLRERGAFVKMPHPDAGEVTMVAPWIRFSETPAALTSPAPAVGQHNQEVFGDLLGLDAAQIADLAKAGAI